MNTEDDPEGIVARVDQRIEDVTGLTLSTAEPLQVVNYGIGGQYETHYDSKVAMLTDFRVSGVCDWWIMTNHLIEMAARKYFLLWDLEYTHC